MKIDPAASLRGHIADGRLALGDRAEQDRPSAASGARPTPSRRSLPFARSA